MIRLAQPRCRLRLVAGAALLLLGASCIPTARQPPLRGAAIQPAAVPSRAPDPPATLPAAPSGVIGLDVVSAAPLTQDGISREMELLLPWFATCYESARHEQSRPRSWPVRLSFEFTIDPDGRISDLAVDAGAAGTRPLVDCATGVLRDQAAFEPAPGSQTQVEYVLDLP